MQYVQLYYKYYLLVRLAYYTEWY